jgi:parallel beta-helix repeat protein
MNKKIIVAVVLFILLVTVFLTIQPTFASHKTLTVPDNYSTINAALQNASDGDTVFVRKGTYNERFVIDKAISLKGEDRDTTIINGNNSGTVVLIRHDNVEVSDLTIMYSDAPNHPYSQWMWSTRLIGIHLLSVKSCNIHGNKVMDCGAGIWLYDSPQNIINGNYLYRNDYGERIEISSNNVFEGNTLTGNWAGMRFISSGNNKLRNNTMNFNTENFAILGAEPCYINDVDISNTVDGKPIYYWIGLSHQSIPSDAGCVVLVNCVGCTVEGLSLAKNLDGIVLVTCMNSNVANNTILQTNGGITTHGCINDRIIGNKLDCINAIKVNGNGTQVINNTITATATGVTIEGNYHVLSDNTIDVTTWQAYMIKCLGSYNRVTGNRLNGTSYTYSSIDGSNNIYYQNIMANCYQLNINSSNSIIAKNETPGITLSDGSGTVVCGNRITNGLGLGIGGHDNFYYANQVENNYYVGVDVHGLDTVTSNNVIYHNNFINNNQQIKNFGGNPSNLWDNGSEGNYWSDYHGSDANGDGFGDTPYLVQSETYKTLVDKTSVAVTGKDNYPLMMPFDVSSVTIELPQWNYTAPSQPPLTTPNISLGTPSTVASTPTPSDVPYAPNQEQAQVPPREKPEPIPTDIVTTVAALSVATIILGIITFHFKKRH